MQTKQQSQESKDQYLTELDQQATYYEELAYAFKSSEAEKIMVELRSRFNDLDLEKHNITSKIIPFPHEYSKDELAKMRALNAKMEERAIDLREFNYDFFMEKAKQLREEVRMIKAGEPLEAAY